MGVWFIPLAVIVMVGFSNAVNLTDGLDGLAALKLGVSGRSPEPAAWATADETVSNR